VLEKLLEYEEINVGKDKKNLSIVDLETLISDLNE
jgi:hypothetical protein